jgi:hypothetical protein
MEAESPVKVLCIDFVPDLQRTAGTEADGQEEVESPQKLYYRKIVLQKRSNHQLLYPAKLIFHRGS